MVDISGTKVFKIGNHRILRSFEEHESISILKPESRIKSPKKYMDFLGLSKFRFWGRGYKIILKDNKNLLIFNKSHLNVLYSQQMSLKFNKTKMIYIF